jgi:exosortase/archaeosortase family protein
LAISVYNVLRISIHAIHPETISVHNWIFNLILIPRWIIVIALFHFYWKKHPSIKSFISGKLHLTEKFWEKLFLNLSIVNIVYFLTIIFIFNRFFFLNGELLLKVILNLSKSILDFFGYESWIIEKTISGSKAALFMDDSCIGMNLMFLFATFIALLPGSVKHKLWFIPMGLIMIVLFNSTRIALIFISVSENNGKYILPLEIHDLFTYPVLILTLLLWIVWINRFFMPKSKRNEELPT